MDSKQLTRDIEQKIKQQLFDKKKVSLLYGPRQVGKTTLVKKILAEYNGAPESGYFLCEIRSVQDILASYNPEEMRRAFGGYKVVAFDEAHKVPNIGLALKILIDTYPEMTIIATGSSSFDLANAVSEPLTGRHHEYFLYPFSMNEIRNNFSYLSLKNNLDSLMLYGSYPDVYLAETVNRKLESLHEIASKYLYRDIFEFGGIRNPKLLDDILRALAFQVGGETNPNEIATLVGADRKTVVSYIGMLKQSFIIFELPPLGKNMRNEIKRFSKYYFYDNGILNYLISNYSGEDLRDMGPLWENLMIAERKKYNHLHSPYHNNTYHWRQDNREVDYIEDYGGHYHPYELKYRETNLNKGAYKFAEGYGALPQLINRDNFADFVLD